MKWIRVENHRGAEQYIDLDQVIRIDFIVDGGTQQVASAKLYAIGGEGFMILGTVSGDVTLKKLHDHVSGAGKEFLYGK